MSRAFLSLIVAGGSLAAAAFLAGCGKAPSSDSLEEERYSPPKGASSNVSVSAEGALRAAVAKPAPDERLALKAKYDDVAAGSFVSLPVQSTGTFTMGETVAYSSTTGLVSHSSAGYLELYVSGTDGGLFLLVEATWDAATGGLDCGVQQNVFGGSPLGQTAQFNSAQVDLRVEESGTAVNVLARATPADSGTGAWTTLYTVAAPSPQDTYVPSFGSTNVNKGGTFYFNRFYLDGDGVGGATSGPILSDLQSADAAITLAETDLAQSPPDIADAASAAALSGTDTAMAESALSAALTQGTLTGALNPTFATRRDFRLFLGVNGPGTRINTRVCFQKGV